MNLELILNIILALFLYEILLKAIARTLISYIFNDIGLSKKNEKKKTFRERLDEKMNEGKKT